MHTRWMKLRTDIRSGNVPCCQTVYYATCRLQCDHSAKFARPSTVDLAAPLKYPRVLKERPAQGIVSWGIVLLASIQCILPQLLLVHTTACDVFFYPLSPCILLVQVPCCMYSAFYPLLCFLICPHDCLYLVSSFELGRKSMSVSAPQCTYVLCVTFPQLLPACCICRPSHMLNSHHTLPPGAESKFFY